jgi:hypothetical protein
MLMRNWTLTQLRPSKDGKRTSPAQPVTSLPVAPSTWAAGYFTPAGIRIINFDLFDRRQGEWRGAYLHESVVVTGAVEVLRGEILHYTCDSRQEHVRRIEFYTDLAAREMIEHGERVNAIRRFLAPSWIFVNTYFLRLGILDGWQGFVIARMAARYVRRKYEKAAQLSRR